MTTRIAGDSTPSKLCPECGTQLFLHGVMLMGNVLTGEEPHPVARWDCPNCEIIVAYECDPAWGWQQWKAQNSSPDGDMPGKV